MNERPAGIIITISQKMLKEKGYRRWLGNFLQCMQLHDLEFTYWMRQCAKPKHDKEVQYVYLCIGNKIRFRTYYAGTQGPGEKTFPDGDGGTKQMYGRAWIVMAGPVARPDRPIPWKGFRGFRYTSKLF